MKKAKYASFFLVTCLIVLAGLSSCNKDDANSPVPTGGMGELVSFGPAGVQLGETISIIGNGLDKVTSVVFVGDSVPQSAFLSQTSSLIRLIVPPNARRGYIILRNNDGTSVTSKTVIDFNVPVVIDTITTANGLWTAKPGTNITISGTHMDWVTNVVFYNATGNITVADTNFVSQSATQIVVKVPMTAQTGLFTLNTAGTKPLIITLPKNLNIVLPAITTLSPNPIAGGKQQLTITGTDLDLVTQVLLTGVANPVTSFATHTATQIVINNVPNVTAPGPVTLIPYSLIPVVSSQTLNVILPAITSLSPNPVNRGSQLTITGTNLDLVTQVVFKGAANPVTSFVTHTATQIVVTVPQDAAFGPVTVYSPPMVPVVSTDALAYVGDPVQLPPLGLALYENGTYQNGISYGWWLSTTPDPSSTDIINIGTTASLKMTFDGGWSGAFYQGMNLSIASYSNVELSVYGGTGTNGLQFQIDFNGGLDNIAFTIAEGKWTNFSIPISTWTSLSSGTVKTMQIQDRGWAGSGTIYFDRIGFK